MSSAVFSTSAAQSRPFVFDGEEVIEVYPKASGAELFGEIQNYENTYKLCYVRGPEGIILELAEQIK